MGRRDIDAKLDQIITKLDQILRQEYHMNRTIDEVLAEVDRQTTQETSMEALLNGLQTIIIQAKGDPGKINAAFETLKANNDKAAAAIVNNTPAAPPAPPVPDPALQFPQTWSKTTGETRVVNNIADAAQALTDGFTAPVSDPPLVP